MACERRKESALTQRIFLVGFENEEGTTTRNLIFHVLGSSNHIYKVFFPEKDKPSCSCPDHVTRKVYCKHIYFISLKVLLIDPDEWLSRPEKCLDKVSSVVKNSLPFSNVTADKSVTDMYQPLYMKNGKGDVTNEVNHGEERKQESIYIRNEDCCVCLGEIQSTTPSKENVPCGQTIPRLVSNEEDVLVCVTCSNGLHIECWRKWASVNKSETCVYCRSKMQALPRGRSRKRKPERLRMIRDQWGVRIS